MITKMLDGAKVISNAAEKEVKEAEAMLKDTEKRWEVIDIDNEDDNTNKSRKKKRKVSLSPLRGIPVQTM